MMKCRGCKKEIQINKAYYWSKDMICENCYITRLKQRELFLEKLCVEKDAKIIEKDAKIAELEEALEKWRSWAR